ncbi:sensor histidine kinase [Amycolatopsis taiwanensis]|uniref:histidine kinase n=1 Tax=Amycolatopsis taiwanensis TaxID=342230 RepID=A0A9W6VIC7_9PSEU|nr:sensor histidine kinase [Amycolatopsis taiwanensis]GLY68289.1 two-component sensor histidine kinase [Amycolatopsis taiwanensis]
MDEEHGGHRRVLIDAVLGASTSAVVAVAIAMDLGGSRTPDYVAYLFAAGLGALMFVRRKFPVLALMATAAGLLAYYAADYPPVGLALPVAAALYSAAEAGQVGVAAATGTALVLVSTFFRLREGDNPSYLLGFETASTIGLMLSAIALGTTVRATRVLRLEKQRTARQAATEREWEAQRRVEEERLRIARDLHDALGHTIAVVSVQTSVATEALDDDPAAARAALATIRLASDEAVRELRTTLGLLTGSGEAEGRSPAGSLRNLDTLVAATTDTGLTVDVRTEGTPVPLPVVVDTTAYRIVQESLTNCLRHARASKAEVLLRYEPDRLEVSVADDGVGAAEPRGGRGLVGMRERAALLGGKVVINARPRSGFRVDASLPMEVGCSASCSSTTSS